VAARGGAEPLQPTTAFAAGGAAPAGAKPSMQPGAVETPAQVELRRAAERARSIAQMEAEDAAEDGGA